MAGVRVVTDSASDLTADEAGALGVEIVPLTIRFGADEFTDGVQLQVDEFYDRMAASDTMPETAAPSPGAFEAAFRAQAAAGADAVVCLNLSGELSATIQAAQNAARALDGDIDVRVIDSRSITAGLGTQVKLAAEAAQQGATVDEVTELIEGLVPRTRVYGALDTLENLKRGGRIGGAKALLGSVLSIKPCIDVSSGHVEEAGKPRTRRKSFQWLHERMTETPGIEQIAVMHGNAPDIEDFLGLIEADFPRDTVRLGKIGPVIGTHGGPRVVGVTFLVPA